MRAPIYVQASIMLVRAPSLRGSLPRDFAAPFWRHPLGAGLATLAAHRLRRRVFAVVNLSRFLNLAGKDLHYVHGVTDDIARALRSLWHARSVPLLYAKHMGSRDAER